MDLTPEQIEELFKRETPDVTICFHELRIQPVKLDIDGMNGYGYIARMRGHDNDNKPMIIDFVTGETVLQETMTRFIEAGTTVAFFGVMDAVASGDTSALAALLSTLPEPTEENK